MDREDISPKNCLNVEGTLGFNLQVEKVGEKRPEAFRLGGKFMKNLPAVLEAPNSV